MGLRRDGFARARMPPFVFCAPKKSKRFVKANRESLKVLSISFLFRTARIWLYHHKHDLTGNFPFWAIWRTLYSLKRYTAISFLYIHRLATFAEPDCELACKKVGNEHATMSENSESLSLPWLRRGIHVPVHQIRRNERHPSDFDISFGNFAHRAYHHVRNARISFGLHSHRIVYRTKCASTLGKWQMHGAFKNYTFVCWLQFAVLWCDGHRMNANAIKTALEHEDAAKQMTDERAHIFPRKPDNSWNECVTKVTADGNDKKSLNMGAQEMYIATLRRMECIRSARVQ